jgi:hypothetical protein
MNDAGFIVGSGTFNGGTRAFLLTPRSGPDTNAPVIIAALSTNFIGAVTFNPLYLTLTVWDDTMVEGKTLAMGSVRVNGPNGFSALASLNNRAPSTNAIRATVTGCSSLWAILSASERFEGAYRVYDLYPACAFGGNLREAGQTPTLIFHYGCRKTRAVPARNSVGPSIRPMKAGKRAACRRATGPLGKP